MRWSLRNQILVPLVVVMLLTVSVISTVAVLVAARERQLQIEGRIQAVTRTIEQSNFPLTAGVLEQVKGLVGAELMVVDAAGNRRAMTDSRLASVTLDLPEPDQVGPFRFNAIQKIDRESFFHTAIPLPPREGQGRQVLHVYYPQSDYDRQMRGAVWPVVVTGLLASLTLGVMAIWFAQRISRPIASLNDQVARIAQGDFQPAALPRRPDELRELAVAVNHMAGQLEQFQHQIRQTEQLHTLGLLGGGLAHQLRNTATGAKLALDFHQQACATADDESLQVAQRQLILLEQYLKKFLSIARPNPLRLEPIDLRDLLNSLMPLVQPAARHARVGLTLRLPESNQWVSGDSEGLEQLVLNLLLNAIEAAQRSESQREPEVVLELVGASTQQGPCLIVTDTGPGPDASIAEKMFEPLITNKPDGVGLGLSVVYRVAQQHAAQVHWRRAGDQTRFEVVFPIGKAD
jgi:signal transduction histidine kinase